MMNGKTALITGATSGIGKATAQLFATKGMRLVLCGRRMEKLNKLKEELSQLTDVTVLDFDVRFKDEVAAKIASLPEKFKEIDVLINNAGNAHGLSAIHEGDIDDWDAMIDGNVKGLLYVSRSVLPQMVARNEGFIVNIGSIAAKEVYGGGNVYCASKFAVDAINKGMRIDLNRHNIRVAGIHPGAVETEFSEVRFKGDKERAKKVYQGFDALMAEDIAEIIYFVISRPFRVTIEDLVVYPTAQAAATIINRT